MSRRNSIIRSCLIGLFLALAACAGEVAPVAATCPKVLLVGDASIMELHGPGGERDTDDVSFMAQLGTPLWSCEFLTEQKRTRVAVSFEIPGLDGTGGRRQRRILPLVRGAREP